MSELEPLPAWTQRASESDAQYAWFKQYAETLGDRDVNRTAAQIGVAAKLLSQAAELHEWDARCVAFDRARAEVSVSIMPDDSEALAMQYAVGIAMMKVAAEALKHKNVGLLKIDQIIKLFTQGAESARRGAGVADLKIEKSVQHRIQSEFEDLLLGE